MIPKRPDPIVIPPVVIPEQAALRIAHEHAVAVRAVEGLRAVLRKDDTMTNFYDEEYEQRTAAAALADIEASGWKP